MASPAGIDIGALIGDRARSIDASGIRRVFEIGATLKDPINLSIGQPDFPVPDAMKRAAHEAIDANRNGYTPTLGVPALRQRIGEHLKTNLGWDAPSDSVGLMVTSGTSGALALTALALLDAGDEAIIPDPYFVIYPNLARITGAKAVLCDTYPDFRMTAERVEPLITDRTKFVLLNSPGNPSGVALTTQECADLLDLCRRKNILLVSDEIYDEFCFTEGLEPTDLPGGPHLCPSPSRLPGGESSTLLIRGFGKSYGCTGWRMGYAAGPAPLIDQMAKFQQYTFVCAPSVAQWGCAEAFECDISRHVQAYQRRRDMALEMFGDVAEITRPDGAFYLFVKIPQRLGMTGEDVFQRAARRNVLVIPGGVFSSRDTHFRISLSAPDERLAEGVEILCDVLRG